MASLDEILASIDAKTVEKIVAGLPLEFKSLKNPKTAVLVALHCCLNGPVGVNKLTTFPIVGAGSIKSLVNDQVSNKSWKGFCKGVATWLEGKNANVKCTSNLLLGTYWPLKEWPISKPSPTFANV